MYASSFVLSQNHELFATTHKIAHSVRALKNWRFSEKILVRLPWIGGSHRAKKHSLRHAYLSGYGSVLHRYGIYCITAVTDYIISGVGYIISDTDYITAGEYREIDIGIPMFVSRKKGLYKASGRTIMFEYRF